MQMTNSNLLSNGTEGIMEVAQCTEITLSNEPVKRGSTERKEKKKGIFRKLSGPFDHLTKRRRKRIKIQDLENEVQECCDKLKNKEIELREIYNENANLKNQISLCDNGLDKILEIKVMGNMIIGDNNTITCNDDDDSPLLNKMNRLFQLCLDEFNAVAERHASLEWKMASVERVLSNIDTKITILKTSGETENDTILEKISEVKELINILQNDHIQEGTILEAADALKYESKENVVPKTGMKLAKHLAIQYASKPETLYAEFGDFNDRPLIERLSPDGLGHVCCRWLVQYMKGTRPKDLVEKLRRMERDVIEEETKKLREKLKKVNQVRSTWCDSSDQSVDLDTRVGYMRSLNESANFITSITSLNKIELKEFC